MDATRRHGITWSAATGAVLPALGARLRTPEAAALLRPVQVERLSALLDAGVTGFRLLGADRIPPETLIGLISAVRERHPDARFITGVQLPVDAGFTERA